MKKEVKKVLFIIGIILVIIIFLMFVSYKSSSKNFPCFGWGNVCSSKCYINQLLDNTMVTNHPVLDVFETHGPNAYLYSFYVPTRKNMSINISALNIGKATIPKANVSFVESDIFELIYGDWWTINSDMDIRNLPAMESVTGNIQFRVKEGVDLMPGKYNLKFRIICPICDEQIYYDYMTICIYRQYGNPVEDCGGIWWHDNWDWWWFF